LCGRPQNDVRRGLARRKPAPRRAAFDLPIAQFDVLDDRIRDHVALRVGQRPVTLPPYALPEKPNVPSILAPLPR
jgi:hypothetical protein